MYLWHGTSVTDPSVIIQSQEGFDVRFGRENCMWGKAVYFAKNASYSRAYAYKTRDSFRQMFLAEVLLGETIKLPQSALTKPPVNEATGIEYDSVQGHTQGSDVFMVYSNQKCYPRYLVTFED